MSHTRSYTQFTQYATVCMAGRQAPPKRKGFKTYKLCGPGLAVGLYLNILPCSFEALLRRCFVVMALFLDSGSWDTVARKHHRLIVNRDALQTRFRVLNDLQSKLVLAVLLSLGHVAEFDLLRVVGWVVRECFDVYQYIDLASQTAICNWCSTGWLC